MSHKAIISAISSVESIEGAENIQKAKCMGEIVVVSKELNVGDVGIFFPVDVQLSEEFCHHNNLFRDKEANKDKEKAGFFDKNRRVRAQPFMKVRSSGLFMGFESLSYTGFTTGNLGDCFDEVNGHKLCQKYLSDEAKEKGASNKVKQAKKNYAPDFLKHVDSEQFKHFSGNIKEGSLVHIHAKVHGTSHRQGYVPIMKELPKWKHFLNKMVGYIAHKKAFEESYEYGHVLGTRNVVLKAGDTDKEGFHGSEQFRFDVFEKVKQHLEKGMTVYGEIAAFANGKSIMPSHSVAGLKDKKYTQKYGDSVTYTYGCKGHEHRFHIYRITLMNAEGTHIDFTQAQIDKWCEQHGFLAPVSVCEPFVYDGDKEKLEAFVEHLTERPHVLTEDYIDPSHVSEGVIVRVDDGSLTPTFYKSKSYAFRVMEGLCEALDTEDAS